MPHWRSMIEKDFLGAWDLVDDSMRPREYTLEILSVKSEVLKTREQPKGKRRCTIRFTRAHKAFVANTTNCETIESMYGANTDAWVGKTITLYQADVRNPKGPGTIKGIRVRPRVPSAKAEAIEARPVDEAMRAEQNAAFGREPGSDDV